MKHRHVVLGLAAPLAAVGLLLVPSAALAATADFTAEATPDQESDGGRAGASASGKFSIDTAAREFCYTVTTKSLDDAVAAHIHKGAAGVNGDVVIPLEQGKFNGGEACVSATGAILEGIISEPAGYYLNVHTPDHQAGAVRGQLEGTGGAPTGVNAGTGGQAQDAAPVLPALVLLSGGALLGVATWRLVRR
jgi:CHRD domain